MSAAVFIASALAHTNGGTVLVVALK